MPRTGRDRVFISYRRSDSAGHAGRLNDDLTRLLGRRVFMDVADIAPGAEFESVIRNELSSCGAVLAVIGAHWLDTLRAPRDDTDYVRIELREALGHQGVTVVPVLVQGASLPSHEALPDDLQSLARHQAVSVRDDRWQDDVTHLARQLRVLLKLSRVSAWQLATGFVALTALGLGVWLNRPLQPPPFDRRQATEIAVAAGRKAASACGAPAGSKGECPAVLRFVPDGKPQNVWYDTGYCEFKGTPFGDCVLRKLEKVRIAPFNDYDTVELGLNIRVEANGTASVEAYQ